MKKIILLLSNLITICSYAYQPVQVKQVFCRADTIVPAIKDYDFYKQKSAGQKTGAWFLVAGGAICIFVAAGMGASDMQSGWVYAFSTEEAPDKKNRENTEKILLYAGGAALLGSIPLFIAGRRNKLKARVSMKNEKLSSLLPAGNGKYAHVITLTIPLSK